MFGKNKKNKNKKSTGKVNMHTMQDDLNVDIKAISDYEDQSLEKSSGPFSGSVSTQGNPEEKKEVVDKSSPFNSADTSNFQDKIQPKAEVNSVSSNKMEDKSFGSSYLDKSSIGSDNREQLQKNEMPTSKPSLSSELESKNKTDIPSVMPRSVDDLTSSVDKSETSDSKNPSTKKDVDELQRVDDEKVNNKEKEPLSIRSKTSDILTYVIMVVLVVAIGVGGYFAWNLGYINIDSIIPGKDDSSQEGTVAVNENTSTKTEENNNTNNESAGSFSDKVNLLAVSDNDFDIDGLKYIFTKKFEEMKNFNGNLLEFTLVDKDNNPIKFSDFSDALGMKLSASVASQLNDDDFSVYLYKNGETEKVGIAIKTMDESKLKSDLLVEEANLVNGVSPLFLKDLTEDDLSGKIFSDGVYNDIEVRFVNLNGSDSVDYAIIEGYLLFATSKDSGRAIMDKVILNNIAIDQMPAEVEGAHDSKVYDIFNENSDDFNELEKGETVIYVE